ncbi:MAG: hypothetical protein KKC03_07025 [Bacteroidetes bacterium]|nr:hypothetical protein [Bacteroidota bacterium]
MKKILLMLLIAMSSQLFAQVNINDYKYVIVPHRFDYLNEADKYQLNSLLKSYLQKKGFTVFFDNENFPVDLATNNCLALKALVSNQSNMFNSKTEFELVNCNNQVAFKSDVGESKSKDFRQSYQESLRNALRSFDAVSYAYNPNAQPVNNAVPGSRVVSNQVPAQQNQVLVQQTIPTPQPVVTIIEAASMDFISNGEEFMLKADGKNFEIFKRAIVDDMVTYGLIGNLKATGQAGIYLATYKKQTSIGYFDAQGNLTIELTDANGQTETKVFKKQ